VSCRWTGRVPAPLERSIAAALLAVSGSAQAAFAELRSYREILHSAIDARCNDLEAGLLRAESAKVVALERELVAIDAALERWRSETCVVHDAVASLSDTELMTQHAGLASRLDALETQLRALPTAPVEPSHVGLTMDTPALLASIAGFGRIVAPLGITAADVTLEGVPSHVRPGQTLYAASGPGRPPRRAVHRGAGGVAGRSGCRVAV